MRFNLKFIGKLYNKLVANDKFFYLLILLISFLALILLQPKLKTKLFRFNRQKTFNDFIEEVKKDNKIDAKVFWEFREFYSPGYFDFNSNYVEISSILQFHHLSAVKSDFLFFRSDKLESTESIVKKIDSFNKNKDMCLEIIFEDKDSIICTQDNSEIKISFVKTVGEMMKANGLFDYIDSEKKLLKDKYWINETILVN